MVVGEQRVLQLASAQAQVVLRARVPNTAKKRPAKPHAHCWRRADEGEEGGVERGANLFRQCEILLDQLDLASLLLSRFPLQLLCDEKGKHAHADMAETI